MLPMHRGVLCRWYSPAAAVRPDLVVVLAPGADRLAGLGQGLEPVLIQAFVAKLPIKALDVAVLHGLSWVDQKVAYPMSLCPCDECTVGELGSVVGSDRMRISTKPRRLI